MTEDSADLTIAMKSTVAQWPDVAGSYAIDFGNAALRQPSQRMRPRGFWGDITNVGKDVVEAVQGDFDESRSVTFNVKAGESGKKSTILKDPKGRLTIDCIDCYITGSWQLQGHIVVGVSWKLVIHLSTTEIFLTRKVRSTASNCRISPCKLHRKVSRR